MKTFRIGFSRQVLFHNIGWEARGIRYIHRLSIVLPEVIIHLLPVLGSGWQSQSSHKKPLPSAAQVVVCGGGVIGSSVAYHLPKFGVKDVILLEQGRYMYS